MKKLTKTLPFGFFVAIFLIFPQTSSAISMSDCLSASPGTYLWCQGADGKCRSIIAPTSGDLTEIDNWKNGTTCNNDPRLGILAPIGCTQDQGTPPECDKAPPASQGIGCCVLSSPTGARCIDVSPIQKDACQAASLHFDIQSFISQAATFGLADVTDIASVTYNDKTACTAIPSCPGYRTPTGEGSKQTEPNFTPVKPLLQINIPTVNFSDIKVQGERGSRYVDIPYLAEYLKGVFNYALGLLAMVAIIIMMIGGVKYIMARGGGGVAEAKKMIGNAIFGLLLGLLSFVILNAVSPSLTNLSTLRTPYIERINVDVEYPPPPPESSSSENDGSSPPPGGKVPFFGQYAAPWGEYRPNGQGGEDPKCQSIRARGCGTTSLAMVLKFYGKNVTPKDTASWGLDCGIPRGAWQPFSRSWTSSPWSDLKFERVDANKAMELASQGRPIVFNCAPCVGSRQNGSIKGYRGHYMVLTGSNDGGQTFTVNDPGANLNSGIVKMTREQVTTPLLSDWQKDCSNDNCRNNYSGSRIIDGKIQNAFKFGLYVHP